MDGCSGSRVVRKLTSVQLSWSNGDPGRLVSETLTTRRLSFGSKEQALLVGETQAEGLPRDKNPVGGRPRGSGLGWSGRLRRPAGS